MPCSICFVWLHSIFWRFVISNSHTHHYTLMSLQASGTWGGTLRPIASRESTDSYEQECSFKLLHDQNFNVACKRGIWYPPYEVMYCQEKMSLRLSVSISHGYTIVILCIYLSYLYFAYTFHILTSPDRSVFRLICKEEQAPFAWI